MFNCSEKAKISVILGTLNTDDIENIDQGQKQLFPKIKKGV